MRSIIKLDAPAVNAALDAAIESRAPVILESPEFEGATINGFLVAGDQRALLMEITGRPAIDLDRLVHVEVSGQIYGERRFSFSSKITSTPVWGDTRALAFARPDDLVVLERRRFLRAKLAPSSKVELAWEAAGQAHRHQATLLNISADGLACRVDDSAAQTMEAHRRVRVSLDLPGATIEDLNAVITNKMPGSEGCSLLGVQFLRNEGDTGKLAQLRQVLGFERNVQMGEAARS